MKLPSCEANNLALLKWKALKNVYFLNLFKKLFHLTSCLKCKYDDSFQSIQMAEQPGVS